MLVLGVGAAVIGSGYKVGTLARMGPGFMPVMLGITLAFMGVLIAGTALASSEPDDGKFLPDNPQWFGWLCILAGPVAVHHPRRIWRDDPGGIRLRLCLPRSETKPPPTNRRSSWRPASRYSAWCCSIISWASRSRYCVDLTCDLNRNYRSLVRLRRRARAAQSDVLLPRRAGRQSGRRAAGHGRGGDDLHPAAADLRDAAGAGDPDAVGGLLRLAIWRGDLLDPAQPAVPSTPCGDLSGRLSADQAGQGRHRARHHRHRLLCRRLLRHHRNDFPGAVPGQDGARVRPGRSMLADAGRICWRARRWPRDRRSRASR